MTREPAIFIDHIFPFLMVNEDTKTYTMYWLAPRLSPCFRPLKPFTSTVSIAFLIPDLTDVDSFLPTERFYPPSTLKRSPSGQLYPEYDYPNPSCGPRIPWVENLCLPRSARSISVTLHEGDTLFLPAGWWHRVEQEGGEEGIAVAVN